MDKKRIIEQMHELEGKIQYQFNNIQLLASAMCVDKPYSYNKKNPEELANECLATIGDVLLKSVLTIKFYNDGKKRKGTLTEEKQPYEENTTFYELVRKEKWIEYSYNKDYFYTDEQPEEDKMPDPKHDPFVEAIIGAIYFDTEENYELVKDWIMTTLFPLLKKYKKVSKPSKEN
ncbi:MAG: hypothetical protein K2J93_04075 [Anaeroplasmataceae bacterium]|nr:hypothetical protein [Anaeroplasmataceae bacterium]